MTTSYLPYTLFAAVFCLAACSGSKKPEEDKPKQFPKPGTVVASAEMPVTDDPLNHFTFSIKVVADSAVASGIYDVDVDYGPNFSEGQLAMPKGGEELKPEVRKGVAPYSFIIGFKVPGDTTFYDYMHVDGNIHKTKMQYIKAYTF
jgi:hypothetical protein